MGRSLIESVEPARQIFEEADAVLGARLSSLCLEGPEEELRLTANTQPAILTVSIAALRALEARGVRADFVAGHSLGEYSALVAAGSLKFADALRVVRKRGEFMQEAVPEGEGAMAALVGCDAETANSICSEAASLGVCAPANLNAPNQIVIAGHRSAVERAVELAKQKGVRKAVLLAVSAPFHCELMKPAAERLAEVLDVTEFADLNLPLVGNVDAEIILAGREAKDALLRQVASPVRWTESVQLMLDQGVRRFIEVGPGKVLSGLVKQISRDSQISDAVLLNVEDSDSLDHTLAAITQVS